MTENRSGLWGLRAVKELIDQTTTYRLMLYYLATLFVVALILSFTSALHTPAALLSTLLVFTVVALAVNTLCARLFAAVTNRESAYITALILLFALPPIALTDVKSILVSVAVAAIAMASKYLLVWQKKHLLNPAALAIVLTTLLFGVEAAWWVTGHPLLLTLTIVGGLVVIYKLRRADLLISFAGAAIVTTTVVAADPLASLIATLQYSPLFFIALVMLTEPSTMPVKRFPRIAFGALVGALSIWAPTSGVLHVSPELALLIGNLFAFFVNPKGRHVLALAGRRPLAKGIYEFVFAGNQLPKFKSGQYLEWTLAGVPYDNRGNRRYFTIASAPEDTELALGVRFYDKPSAFKRTLAALPLGACVTAVSPAGDFTLPRDKNKKLAFIAGGIGVTPFVSMARHMRRMGEKRDAVLLYAAKSEDEVAYKEIFLDTARLGFRIAYAIGMPIDVNRIQREIPDYRGRLFYISGPPPMVEAMKKLLRSLGVSRFSIKTDFFPGLA